MDYTLRNPGNYGMRRNNVSCSVQIGRKITKTTQTDTEVQGRNTSGIESTGEPASSPCRREGGG